MTSRAARPGGIRRRSRPPQRTRLRWSRLAAANGIACAARFAPASMTVAGQRVAARSGAGRGPQTGGRRLRLDLCSQGLKWNAAGSTSCRQPAAGNGTAAARFLPGGSRDRALASTIVAGQRVAPRSGAGRGHAAGLTHCGPHWPVPTRVVVFSLDTTINANSIGSVVNDLRSELDLPVRECAPAVKGSKVVAS